MKNAKCKMQNEGLMPPQTAGRVLHSSFFILHFAFSSGTGLDRN
jgi:hypothetical protein